MSFRYYVKAADYIPTTLFEQFDILQHPVIYHENIDQQDIAKKFVENVIDITLKIKDF